MIEDRQLELSPEALRALVRDATERVVQHLASLPDQPSFDTDDAAAVARSLVEPLPEKGRTARELLDLLFEKVIPKSLNTAGPGYLAYIPGGGLPHSAVADFIANATNRYVGVFAAAPGLAQLEANVVRWFADMVGYPSEAGGILTSGGSLANFSAVVAARVARLPEDFLRGTIYTSDQAHHSITKAAMLAGFPQRNVRAMESDEHFRVRVDVLANAITTDRANGLQPFLIVGNAGTTNTGAVDPLGDLADLAAREAMWFHVDGAYGGFFVLTKDGRRTLAAIERADSIVLDPHKGLFLPYGTGALLVRDRETLRRAHALSADYMPSMQDDPERVDFNLLSPELSRDFRGLRVWLPLAMHGIGPFRSNLEEKLALARYVADELRKDERIEIVAEPELSIVAFRLRVTAERVSAEGARGTACPPYQADEANRELLQRINARRRVYMTGTVLRGAFTLRVCVLSFRTHADRIEMALSDIREKHS